LAITNAIKSKAIPIPRAGGYGEQANRYSEWSNRYSDWGNGAGQNGFRRACMALPMKLAMNGA